MADAWACKEGNDASFPPEDLSEFERFDLGLTLLPSSSNDEESCKTSHSEDQHVPFGIQPISQDGKIQCESLNDPSNLSSETAPSCSASANGVLEKVSDEATRARGRFAKASTDDLPESGNESQTSILLDSEVGPIEGKESTAHDRVGSCDPKAVACSVGKNISSSISLRVPLRQASQPAVKSQNSQHLISLGGWCKAEALRRHRLVRSNSEPTVRHSQHRFHQPLLFYHVHDTTFETAPSRIWRRGLVNNKKSRSWTKHFPSGANTNPLLHQNTSPTTLSRTASISSRKLSFPSTHQDSTLFSTFNRDGKHILRRGSLPPLSRQNPRNCSFVLSNSIPTFDMDAKSIPLHQTDTRKPQHLLLSQDFTIGDENLSPAYLPTYEQLHPGEPAMGLGSYHELVNQNTSLQVRYPHALKCILSLETQLDDALKRISSLEVDHVEALKYKSGYQELFQQNNALKLDVQNANKKVQLAEQKVTHLNDSLANIANTGDFTTMGETTQAITNQTNVVPVTNAPLFQVATSSTLSIRSVLNKHEQKRKSDASKRQHRENVRSYIGFEKEFGKGTPLCLLLQDGLRTASGRPFKMGSHQKKPVQKHTQASTSPELSVGSSDEMAMECSGGYDAAHDPDFVLDPDFDPLA